jgi:uncharacterized protein YecE (DUF72 family)
VRLRFALGSWSNAHFEHTLYPLRTPHVERLPRYASVFDAVELDILHHQEAEVGKLEDWAAQVPEGFLFLPKMHKGVTHGSEPSDGADAVLVPRMAKGNAELLRAVRARVQADMEAAAQGEATAGPGSKAREATARPDEAAEPGLEARRRRALRFLDDLRPLREAGVLGPTLLQFPPSLRREQGWDLLVRLLSLDEPGRFACEFRHTSWFVPAVERVLEDTQTPLVWSTFPKAFAPPWRTGAYGYVRFTGPHVKTRGRHVQVQDRAADVAAVAKRLRQASWGEAFVIVTNGFEGNAVDSMPAIAAALGEEGLAKRLRRPPGGHWFPDPQGA